MDGATRRFLSLGAGVQSSTLALMMKHGEVPCVDAAIFADTQAEPANVYRWLEWLESVVPFPVYRVTAGSLREAILKRVAGEKSGSGGPPFFTTRPNDTKEGRLPRQCTRDYKLVPLERKIRELCGLQRGQRVPRGIVLAESVIGISFDEWQRMKPARKHYMRNVYPLVDRRLTRLHCLQWMEQHGYPRPPKSACTFCPFHDNALWKTMKEREPDAFADAVSVDLAIRKGYRNSTQNLYVHRSLKPLDQVDFRTAADFGQLDAFASECEGMCGV